MNTHHPDTALGEVAAAFRSTDPSGQRVANVLRESFDQLYDGRRTGRFRLDQLTKTEKAHFGSIFEINLRREFDGVIHDGLRLDYQIAGHEVDAKYSHTSGWMLPPECFDEILLVATADDIVGQWSLGLIRASQEVRTTGSNRDAKATLSAFGRTQIRWLWRDQPLPPNVLTSLPEHDLVAIFAPRSGQARVNELLRRVVLRRIGRNTIATVAMQDDYMKRVRYNGGARSALQPEGILIPSGDYEAHRNVAQVLEVDVPRPGEVISIPVVPAAPGVVPTVHLDGRAWRVADPAERRTVPAPLLPPTRS